jgi:hypothetical protein
MLSVYSGGKIESFCYLRKVVHMFTDARILMYKQLNAVNGTTVMNVESV